MINDKILDHMDNALRQLHEAKMLMQGQQTIAFDESESRIFVFLIKDIQDTMQSLQSFIEKDKDTLRRVWDAENKSE